ncbi:beta-defensin 135 [Echinops telfairi]|uniref:Beta-defensin n=1 Tax=Echinops telfairi TaxID=9371 RepID=A0ABM1VIU7_ECHTE|nr:beta-defensin 135 [Echinops telfairi]
MKSLLLVLVILVLLSQIPPVRSGPNIYIRKFFSTCWRTKGICKRHCYKNEIFHILCDTTHLCCINKRYVSVQIGTLS